MIWPKAACLILPAITYSCSSPGNFQCNINANGQIFRATAVNADMSISYPSATPRTPCGFDMKILAGDDVIRGNKPLVITKIDLNVLPKHGTVKWKDSSISYTPQNEYAGSDNFTVVVTGSAGDVAGASKLDFTVDIK